MGLYWIRKEINMTAQNTANSKMTHCCAAEVCVLCNKIILGNSFFYLDQCCSALVTLRCMDFNCRCSENLHILKLPGLRNTALDESKQVNEGYKALFIVPVSSCYRQNFFPLLKSAHFKMAIYISYHIHIIIKKKDQREYKLQTKPASQ